MSRFFGRTGRVAAIGYLLGRRWKLNGRTAGRIHYSRSAARYYRGYR